ncbi:MAG: adenylate/guanylate cyclase domain-containing protein [Acidimicrobiales bacterium]
MAVTCPSCGVESSDGKRFCADCGQALALVCPTCSAPVEAGKRFCADCGTELAGLRTGPAPDVPLASAEPAKPVAERRLTTVLFGDLVGFTTLSESRDAEDVRELLSDYFAMAKTVVSRYGGTIEKFIGDAVMAVWGVPVTHEDDAERAVRAGLDLVSGMAGVAASAGVSDLTMRVGILTGEVAVTLGAVGEGMVAGDAVNTAARIQSVAEPGQVWVDDITRSLTAAAVSYSDAGEHLLKGKVEPVRLHAAGAIVASVGGAQRVDGLEAPFVGRDHELRLVKELFHGAVEERRPRLVAVSGLAGVGKTRLAWEYEKYVDGIAGSVWWHRSRALSYGDGVSFWAIAEMVRARLGVTDGDPSHIVDQHLTTLLASIAPDATEREWLRPRIAALLGLESSSFGRDDLFSAWATFFERVGAGDTVVMVLDDMQHADVDLLDFLDYVLDSARYSLFVLTLARPDLADARPGWGTGRRATAVYLEPLGERAMGEIVDGLVEGLPEVARSALVERSEGIPVYALEMVRALIDRDVVIPREGRYVVAPDAEQRVDLATLDAPPSLQALIAARLDALTPDERQLVQEATAHGLAFSRDGIEATSTVADLDAVLGELVRKEIFELHTDRFSAEHGQYRFVQALVRTVAYETLSRRDRKMRHLAVARYLEQSHSDEYAALIARHFLDAVDSGPDDADASELIALALDQLERAARRAEALGSPDEALRHYTTALGCDLEPGDRARLLEGAARTAKFTNRYDEAVAHAEQARIAYESLDRRVDAGRVIALIGDVLVDRGEPQAAVDLVRPYCDSLEDVPGADEANFQLVFILGRAYGQLGDPVASTYTERALVMAEARQDWGAVGTLLNRLYIVWMNARCPTVALALLRACVDLGRRHRQPTPTIFGLLNLSASLKNRDLDGALVAGREAVETSMQAGRHDLLPMAAVNLGLTCWVSGDWDEAERLYVQLKDDLLNHPLDTALFRAALRLVGAARAEPIEVEGSGTGLEDPSERHALNPSEYVAPLVDGLLAEARGDAETAARELVRSTDLAYALSGLDDDFGILWPLAVESALAVGQVAEAERLLLYIADAPPGLVTPLTHAHLPRLRALIGVARGDADAGIDADLELATQELRDFGARFYLGRVLLERGNRLADRGDQDAAAALLAEAEQTFVDLKADRWVTEVRRVGSLH